MLLVIIWLISPIALIPILISISSKKNKLTDFITALLGEGRISREEFSRLRTNAQIAASNMYFPQNQIYQNRPPYPNNQTDYGYYYNQPAAVRYTPYQNPGYANNAYSAANTYPAKRKTPSSVSLLVIGVIFVILAGIVFSTAAWLYLSDWQRTAVIFAAAAFFFAVSALFGKKLSLENTGIAFYMLGGVFSSITFLTAGYFSLMGDWLSFFGDGRYLLIAVAALLISAISLYGRRLYKKAVFLHISLYSSAFFLTFTSMQITDSVHTSIFIMSLIAAAAAFVLFSGYVKTEISQDTLEALKSFSTVLTSITSVFGISAILIGLGEREITNILLSLLYLAQAVFYAYAKNSKGFAAASVPFAVILTYQCFFKIFIYDVDILLSVGLALFVVSVVYRFVGKLRTPFSDIFFPIVISISGLALIIEDSISAAVIFALVFAEMLFLSCEHGGGHLAILRIFVPVPLGICVLHLCDEYITDNYSDAMTAAYIILTLIYSLTSLAFIFSSKNRRHLSLMTYSFGAAAALALFILTAFADEAYAFITVMVLAAMLFSVCSFMKNNILSAAPIIAVYIAVSGYIDLTEVDSGYYVFALSSVFAILAAVSRLMFADKLTYSSNGKFRTDTAAFGMFLAPFTILSDLYGENRELWVFIATIGFTVSLLNLWRRGNDKTFNLCSLTAAAAFACLAIYKQPFIHIENAMIRNKLDLVPLLMFGIAVRFIWRERRKLASDLSFAVNLAAVLALVWDALYYENLFNTLFVLFTALFLLIAAFTMRSKRWFITSASVLVGLTLYIMKDYLSEIDWWVYLLTAGIILIAIAALNEYCKSRNCTISVKTITEKFNSFFSENKQK